MSKLTPVVLQSYYYNVFAGEQGLIVLDDIKRVLTGVGTDTYEGVDPFLPHNELAANTATRNAWDMIEGMTQDVVGTKKNFWWLVKQTVIIYKHNKKVK
jgi:hypothetical protein